VTATVAGFKALVRDDRESVLSVVTKSYGVVQNAEALTLLDAAVGEGSAVYHVAGALDEGRTVFLLAEVNTPGHVWTLAGEEHKPYLLLYTSHDGSKAVTLKFCVTRVVCMNTLSVALREQGAKVSIKHTRTASERVQQAAAVMTRARAYFKGFSERVLRLAAQQFTVQEATTITEAVIPAVKIDGKPTVTDAVEAARGKIVALFAGQRESDVDRRIAGTKWGYLNAVTAFTDHNQRRRGGAEGRMSAIAIEGSADAIKQRAMDLLAA
jgi:phage/plasmid-like protein (TIGR03299 family)